MLSPASTDISVLSAKVTWDISGSNPAILVENLSSGPGLVNMTWWFEATSPTGSLIHQGSATSPDINGAWTNYTISDPWPKPFNSIEWSGPPYVLKLYAKDSNGNVYNVEYAASICRPFGNTQLSKSPYGLASTNVQVKCDMARVLFENQTNVSYQGLKGTMNASTLRVVFPIDETQTIPAPFAISNFATALVPISYSSDNYQFVTQQFYTYDQSPNVSVKIRYQQKATFAVYCNIDLGPLVCEIDKLVDQLETGSCSNAVAANEKLMLINSKMALVFIGMMQPLTGVNVPELIKEIEAIGGFACNCCSAPTGIIPTTASIIDGYAFTVNSQGGDVQGNFSQVGSNIVLNIWDKAYVYNISQATLDATDAFSVITTNTNYQKTYSLNVDLGALATDMANTIGADGDILNLWKSVLGIGSAATIVVDGGCIFQSNAACDYFFTLSNIPASTTFAQFSSINVNNVNQTKSYAFNQTNLSGFQTYLNNMGLGVWTVTNLGSGVIQVATANNTNNIGGITYKVAGTTYSADLSRECTGYTAITIDQFAAYVVNYLCQLNDSNIVTSSPSQICYIDSLGAKQIANFDAGVSLQVILQNLFAGGCTTVDYIKGLGAVNCEAIKTVFPSNSSLNITANDFALGTKGGGVCSRVSYTDIFRYQLQTAKSDAFTRNLFCELVTLCGSGLACEPFSYFQLIVTEYNTTCTEATGLQYTLS